MPSPFPGMDPYLEAPRLWPDVHGRLVFLISESLQQNLPGSYYTELQTRVEIGHEASGTFRTIAPDVSVREGPLGVAESLKTESAGVATLAEPAHIELPECEPLDVGFIEIRNAGMGDVLVTVIEVLSPTNKRPGRDRETFTTKQNAILMSQTHWIEIDLLRTGQRIACDPRVVNYIEAHRYHYTVTLSRADKRKPSPMDIELYGFTIRDKLPTIPVPLLAPDPDVPLDLAHVFNRAYDTGPYRKIIRYTADPDPPLDPDNARWSRELCAEIR